MLVSVIVPVYNTEDYLADTMASLCRQTYSDIEIIAIDDGSTDSSAERLAEWQRRDDRIRVLQHADSQSLGATRNHGAEVAAGEYVMFVDSDDWLEPDAVATLVRRAARRQAQLVPFGLRCVDAQTRQDSWHTPFGSATELSPWRAFMWILENNLSACTKFVHRQLLADCPPFPSRVFFEDHHVTPIWGQAANGVALLPEALYNYRVNRPGSIRSSASMKLIVDWFDSFAVLTDHLLKHRVMASMWREYAWSFFSRTVNGLLTADISERDMDPSVREALVAEALRRLEDSGVVDDVSIHRYFDPRSEAVRRYHRFRGRDVPFLPIAGVSLRDRLRRTLGVRAPATALVSKYVTRVARSMRRFDFPPTAYAMDGKTNVAVTADGKLVKDVLARRPSPCTFVAAVYVPAHHRSALTSLDKWYAHGFFAPDSCLILMDQAAAALVPHVQHFLEKGYPFAALHLDTVYDAWPPTVVYHPWSGPWLPAVRRALPRARHVFTGHGESDKLFSAESAWRQFDRILVAGPASVDRLRGARILGSDDAWAIEIGMPYLFDGRPTLLPVRNPPRRVIYAPTWENGWNGVYYNSINRRGFARRVIDALLHSGVEVWFRPHPFSGSDQRKQAGFRDIARLISQFADTPGFCANVSPHAAFYGYMTEHQSALAMHVDCADELDLQGFDAVVTDVSSMATWAAVLRIPCVTLVTDELAKALAERMPFLARSDVVHERDAGMVYEHLCKITPERTEALARYACKEQPLGNRALLVQVSRAIAAAP
jgi:glycosyltransferase involved in cell wall biosynthesis